MSQQYHFTGQGVGGGGGGKSVPTLPLHKTRQRGDDPKATFDCWPQPDTLPLGHLGAQILVEVLPPHSFCCCFAYARHDVCSTLRNGPVACWRAVTAKAAVWVQPSPALLSTGTAQ